MIKAQTEQAPTNERSEFKNAIIRAGKIAGGVALGAASGYAMARGVETIVPIEERFTSLFEGTVTAGLAYGSAFLTSEIVE